jgi:hypothetical protein
MRRRFMNHLLSVSAALAGQVPRRARFIGFNRLSVGLVSTRRYSVVSLVSQLRRAHQCRGIQRENVLACRPVGAI